MSNVNVIDDEIAQPRSVEPFATSMGAVHERLRALAVPDEAIYEVLTVEPGTTLYLSTEPEHESAITPKLLMSGDLREYKRWIGRPDNPAGGESYWKIPEPWSGRAVGSSTELTAAEALAMENAGRIYLFGNSSQVETYRDILETLRAPFVAAVFAVRCVHIHPGARLVVRGLPAVLLFDHLIIEDGGQLVTYTATHATFGLLEKCIKATECN